MGGESDGRSADGLGEDRTRLAKTIEVGRRDLGSHVPHPIRAKSVDGDEEDAVDAVSMRATVSEERQRQCGGEEARSKHSRSLA